MYITNRFLQAETCAQLFFLRRDFMALGTTVSFILPFIKERRARLFLIEFIPILEYNITVLGGKIWSI